VTEVVVADIGGTHARFAIASLAGGHVAGFSEVSTLKTNDHASLQIAWDDFGSSLGRPLPRAAAIAVAGPVGGEVLRFTNNPWVIRPSLVREKLAVDAFTIVNDFAAVAHAIGGLPPKNFAHLCGPDRPLPTEGVISVIGPGTGLGVAQLVRNANRAIVVQTEGGHIDYAPLDTIEDAILSFIRRSLTRVSAERIVSGPGLANIYQALAAMEGRQARHIDDPTLWTSALCGEDHLAAAALDRFCLALGAVAGDIALAQGATGVVLAGGLSQRLASHLPRSGFVDRFVAKGRFEAMMINIPVKLLTHPQPGLFGAAAAFAAEHS
jgi:glucokinase